MRTYGNIRCVGPRDFICAMGTRTEYGSAVLLSSIFSGLYAGGYVMTETDGEHFSVENTFDTRTKHRWLTTAVIPILVLMLPTYGSGKPKREPRSSQRSEPVHKIIYFLNVLKHRDSQETEGRASVFTASETRSRTLTVLLWSKHPVIQRRRGAEILQCCYRVGERIFINTHEWMDCSHADDTVENSSNAAGPANRTSCSRYNRKDRTE